MDCYTAITGSNGTMATTVYNVRQDRVANVFAVTVTYIRRIICNWAYLLAEQVRAAEAQAASAMTHSRQPQEAVQHNLLQPSRDCSKATSYGSLRQQTNHPSCCCLMKICRRQNAFSFMFISRLSFANHSPTLAHELSILSRIITYQMLLTFITRTISADAIRCLFRQRHDSYLLHNSRAASTMDVFGHGAS